MLCSYVVRVVESIQGRRDEARDAKEAAQSLGAPDGLLTHVSQALMLMSKEERALCQLALRERDHQTAPRINFALMRELRRELH
jgi:hypothetical protein